MVLGLVVSLPAKLYTYQTNCFFRSSLNKKYNRFNIYMCGYIGHINEFMLYIFLT